MEGSEGASLEEIWGRGDSQAKAEEGNVLSLLSKKEECEVRVAGAGASGREI